MPHVSVAIAKRETAHLRTCLQDAAEAFVQGGGKRCTRLQVECIVKTLPVVLDMMFAIDVMVHQDALHAEDVKITDQWNKELDLFLRAAFSMLYVINSHGIMSSEKLAPMRQRILASRRSLREWKSWKPPKNHPPVKSR